MKEESRGAVSGEPEPLPHRWEENTAPDSAQSGAKETIGILDSPEQAVNGGVGSTEQSGNGGVGSTEQATNSALDSPEQAGNGDVRPIEQEEDKAPASSESGGNDSAVAPDMATLLSEAERRGYLRGRNENIERLMGTAAAATPAPDSPLGAGADDIPILNHTRRNWWE